MKKSLIAAATLVGLIAALAVYLAVTASNAEEASIRFPLSAKEQALVAAVPESADSFAVIAGAASTESRLRANPATRELLEKYATTGPLPQPWMLGNASAVIWRSGKETTYLLRLDPLRGLLARLYLMWDGDDSASRLLLEPPSGPALAPEEVARISALAAGLPAADALVVQREERRGAFPPIGRPAVSSLRITPAEIDLVSRAPLDPDSRVLPRPVDTRLPQSAMISASFSSAPRLLGEMNRMIGAKASDLVSDGGKIAIYRVDTRKLLPRPHEVLAVPATPERRDALQHLVSESLPAGIAEATGFRIETGELGGELLVAFDDDSLAAYRRDAFSPVELPANLWAVRIDPARAIPMLEELSSNPGLRFLAPRLYRSARDLDKWIAALGEARSIEAAANATGEIEELRVRIRSK